jgi:hypothetical protein
MVRFGTQSLGSSTYYIRGKNDYCWDNHFRLSLFDFRHIQVTCVFPPGLCLENPLVSNTWILPKSITLILAIQASRCHETLFLRLN